jgi:hypothetical protein
MGSPTHQGGYGLYPGQKKSQRIFSGTAETMFLTVNIDSPPGQVKGKIEVLVNGAPIPNGIINKYGFDARTFTIQRVKVVDILLRSPDVVTGHYDISVPVCCPTTDTPKEWVAMTRKQDKRKYGS